MGELVAGAVLGGFLQLIFSEANISAAARKLFGFYGVEKDLEKIESWMPYIMAVIGDVGQSYSNSQAVRVCMADLKQVAGDMDDILWEMLCRRLLLHVQSNIPIRGKYGRVFLILKSKVEIKFVHKIVGRKLKKRIVEVLKKLEVIRDAANLIGLKNIVETQFVEPRQIGNKERQTTQTMDKSRMVGRECDRNRIIDMLCAHDGTARKNYTVISIVGMGGLGKTTLAQLVFNDEVVKSMFDITSWACVSDIFNPNEVWKQLVKRVEPGMSHGAIEDRLKHLIQNKRFLLVLDDMWTEDVLDWYKLSTSFNHGSRGSKIIVTTRSKAVARTVESNVNTTYSLGVMGNEECWNLFHEKVFGDAVMTSEKRKLEAIGKQIVDKCGGCPLAVKVIGSVLLANRSEEKLESKLNKLWTHVMEYEECRDVFHEEDSYYYQPYYLKRCYENSNRPEDLSYAYSAFMTNVPDLYKQMMKRASDKVKLFLKTISYADMIETGRPQWLDQHIWEGLCRECRMIDERQKMAEMNKSNYPKLKDEDITWHTGGTVSTEIHETRLTQELGRPATFVEVFDRTRRADKGKGPYKDRKSEGVVEWYKERMLGKYGSEGTSTHPKLDEDAYRYATGKENTGIWYGQGSTTMSALQLPVSSQGGSSRVSRSSQSNDRGPTPHLDVVHAVDPEMMRRLDLIEERIQPLMPVVDPTYIQSVVRDVMQEKMQTMWAEVIDHVTSHVASNIVVDIAEHVSDIVIEKLNAKFIPELRALKERQKKERIMVNRARDNSLFNELEKNVRPYQGDSQDDDIQPPPDSTR